MDIDPKTIVTYPLFTLVIYLILHLIFDLPTWTVFIALFIIAVFFIAIILIELFK